ncbi:MAG: glycosyltransferase family 39 protein [Chloroflexi bacterium]|nr:glycosyltransferase family 39 protein [Chloroflexota bacterium]
MDQANPELPVSKERLLVLGIILASTFLLTWQLQAKSLWIDELFTTEVVTQPTVPAVIAAVRATEGRPPLYYILLHDWTDLAGTSDFCLRYFSILAAIACLPALYILAQRLLDGSVALTATALLAFSPLFLLYSRMARAYFLAVLFALMAAYFTVRLLDHESKGAWAGYFLSALALLYTDYMTASLLLPLNLYIFLRWWQQQSSDRYRPFWFRWILAQGLLLVGFLPWLPALLGQTNRYESQETLADLSQGPLSYLVKLAQPVLVFSVGETLLPWNPVALVGFPAIALLALAGLVVAWRRYRMRGLLAILATLVPVLFTVFIVTGWLVRYMTFVWIGARTLQALPFYLVLVAVGLQSLRSQIWRFGMAAVIAITFIVASLNYYQDRDFINPVYVIPSREIVSQVLTGARPGDVLVAPRDSLFAYYYPASQDPYPLFDSNDTAKIEDYIRTHDSPRVWLVTVGRDRGRDLDPTDFIAWLQTGYTSQQHWGYAEQSATYRRFKESLTKRPAYQYKAELALYGRK